MEKCCRTCEWWSRLQEDMTWGDCELAGSQDGNQTHTESLSMAWDQESYHAGLHTHASFCCIQHLPNADLAD